MTSDDYISKALAFIPSDDRDVWVVTGMAIKAELGDGGFDLFDSWSQSSDKYKPRDVATAWRSFKAGGGITIKTLWKLARDHGYVERDTTRPAPDRDALRRRQEAEAAEARLVARQHATAAARAEAMVVEAHPGWNNYLVNKKLSGLRPLIWSGSLEFESKSGQYIKHFVGQVLVPVRHVETRQLQSVQLIDDSGEKLFLQGGKMSEGVHIMGPPIGKTILCEGFATGCSIRVALDAIHQTRIRVAVCFSAYNMTVVAKSTGDWVVADNDASGAGQRHAKLTGLPTWMPEQTGWDANDVHVNQTLKTLSEHLRVLIYG